jgi:acetate CoA/acetoacetate CoA-transferase alpha subunit
VADGAVVMIGGFMGVGSPRRIIDALVARGLAMIDNDRPGWGVGIGISTATAPSAPTAARSTPLWIGVEC